MSEVRGGQESCPVHQGPLCEAVDLCSKQSHLKALKGFPRFPHIWEHESPKESNDLNRRTFQSVREELS